MTAGRIHTFREPEGGTYRRVRPASRGERITPLAFPDVTLAMDEILG